MNTLNLGSDDEPVVKKKSNTRYLKIALGLAAVILIPTIGSTLAGTIAIGTGAIEFGQGVVTTAACDTSITVTPTTAYTSDTFTVSTIAVSNLNFTSCNGSTLKIKVLSGTTPQIISTGANTTQCSVVITTTTAAVTESCAGIAYSSGIAGSFTLTPSATLGAVFLDRITIESATT